MQTNDDGLFNVREIELPNTRNYRNGFRCGVRVAARTHDRPTEPNELPFYRRRELRGNVHVVRFRTKSRIYIDLCL